MDILGILSSLPDPHSRHPTFLLSEGKAMLLGQTTLSLSERLSSGMGGRVWLEAWDPTLGIPED